MSKFCLSMVSVTSFSSVYYRFLHVFSTILDSILKIVNKFLKVPYSSFSYFISNRPWLRYNLDIIVMLLLFLFEWLFDFDCDFGAFCAFWIGIIISRLSVDSAIWRGGGRHTACVYARLPIYYFQRWLPVFVVSSTRVMCFPIFLMLHIYTLITLFKR